MFTFDTARGLKHFFVSIDDIVVRGGEYAHSPEEPLLQLLSL
jgi:hypothetical protein